jgi:hypothetical protein
MPVGDQEAAVIVCVNASLKRRGYFPPYDTTQKMNGIPVFGYQSETMIMFHRQVKSCLAGKGYSYVYSETTDYMNQTLAMKLAEIYAAIDVKTSPRAHVPAVPLETVSFEAPAGVVAPKRAKKKAAKPARATAKLRPGKKKAVKKKSAAKARTSARKKRAERRK